MTERVKGEQINAAPLTGTFIQTVPDKCDRIVWRGQYYHLPINAAHEVGNLGIASEGTLPSAENPCSVPPVAAPSSALDGALRELFSLTWRTIDGAGFWITRQSSERILRDLAAKMQGEIDKLKAQNERQLIGNEHDSTLSREYLKRAEAAERKRDEKDKQLASCYDLMNKYARELAERKAAHPMNKDA